MSLQIATTADAEAIAAIYAPIVRETEISFEAAAPTPEEMAIRIARNLQTHPWLVFKKDDEVLGYAYATPHRSREAYRWSCETSVYIGEAARRTGIAKQLYLKLFETLKSLGYANALAGITLPNAPSVGFHEHIGFQLIGIYKNVGFKNGKWRDVGWWNCPLQKLSNDPGDPLPFAENPHLFAAS